ncbi:MAG: hypothetical protein ACYSUV_20055 [Planctomycetota bacterium]|jgi:hypothetical protein
MMSVVSRPMALSTKTLRTASSFLSVCREEVQSDGGSGPNDDGLRAKQQPPSQADDDVAYGEDAEGSGEDSGVDV